MQQGGIAEEMERSVSPHGSAGDPAVAGQLQLRHQLFGVFRAGLHCSRGGEILHKCRHTRYEDHFIQLPLSLKPYCEVQSFCTLLVHSTV